MTSLIHREESILTNDESLDWTGRKEKGADDRFYALVTCTKQKQDMASSSSSTDFNIDRVYRAFSQVMDHGEETLIGLPEFVLAFRELAK